MRCLNSKIILIVIVPIVIGLVIFSISGNFNSNQTPEPIKIAINEWPGYAHAFLAYEKGFFEKNGVDVELVFDRDYSVSQQRYVDGEVDGVFEVLSDTMFRNTQ